jgi:DNA (cytosine-5)-methyltransferase 1
VRRISVASQAFSIRLKRGACHLSASRPPKGKAEAICLASEGESVERRAWPDFCELQGLPRDFDLPGWSIAAKYRAVGNGVHVGVARVIARAIRDATCAPRGRRLTDVRLCACRCGRILTGRQKAATTGCRKRLERKRKPCPSGLSPLSSSHTLM